MDDSSGIEDVEADTDIVEVVQKLSRTFPEVDELAIATNYLVSRTHAAFLANLTRDSEAVGLSPARLGVVRQLYFAKGKRLPMKDLVASLGVSGGNVTRLVAGLAAQGYIKRVTPEENRRTTFAELTPAGALVFERAMPEILEASNSRLAQLSQEEKRELVRLLTKLRHALSSRPI